MINFDIKDKSQIYQLIVAISAVTLIIVGCLIILSPFFPAILVATILTLSTWPAFEWMTKRLQGRVALAAGLMTLVLAACFIAPLIIIGTSASDNFGQTYNAIQQSLQGDTGQVAGWLKEIPVVGEKAAKHWMELTSDKQRMQTVLQEYAGPMSQTLLSLGKTIGYGLLDLTIGVIVSYFFFRHGTRVAVRIRALILTFGGERGEHLLDISKKTLIGVVYGILGTALAQGALAAFGFWVSGVPGASFLGLLTFFLSFIPMGPPIIWVPAAIWLISEGNTGWGIFLLAWGTIIISAIDNVMKPYFISIGSNLPFILVMFGIGGGALAYGFIGIFIGPTLLALAYTLVLEWSNSRKISPEENFLPK